MPSWALVIHMPSSRKFCNMHDFDIANRRLYEIIEPVARSSNVYAVQEFARNIRLILRYINPQGDKHAL